MKIQKEVFDPIVADWQEEYFEALSKKEIWKSRRINMRYTYAFLAAMWQKSPVGDLIEFIRKIMCFLVDFESSRHITSASQFSTIEVPANTIESYSPIPDKAHHKLTHDQWRLHPVLGSIVSEIEDCVGQGHDRHSGRSCHVAETC